MLTHQKQINELFAAELQFRLASAVRLATNLKTQPLDLPTEWVHGQQRVKYEEIALRQDQAEYAAVLLHQSATFLMATAIRNAIPVAVVDPKSSSDHSVQAAYQIARLIRNAFSHKPYSPIWSIDPDCRDRVFAVPDIISLDTTGLDGETFDWRQYGGPLALYKLCRFVRFEVMKDRIRPRKEMPEQQKSIYQQGDLILQKIDQLPPSAVPLEIERQPDGGIPLGGGYAFYPQDTEQTD